MGLKSLSIYGPNSTEQHAHNSANNIVDGASGLHLSQQIDFTQYYQEIQTVHILNLRRSSDHHILFKKDCQDIIRGCIDSSTRPQLDLIRPKALQTNTCHGLTEPMLEKKLDFASMEQNDNIIRILQRINLNVNQVFRVEKVSRIQLDDDSHLIVDPLNMKIRILSADNKYGKISSPNYSFEDYSNASDKQFMRNFYNQKKRVVKEKAKVYHQHYDTFNRQVIDLEQFKNENRISYLASKCRTQTPRRTLMELAKKFSLNLQKEQDKQKYVNIYKNLLRDMKIYYQQRFGDYIKQYDNNLMKSDKDKMFPAEILLFVQKTFDKQMICKMEQISGQETLLKHVAYTLGAIIDTKTMIQSLQAEMNTDEEQTSNDLIQYGVKIKTQLEKIYVQDYQMINNSFFGMLSDKSPEFKKLKTIEVYRFFFRFSIEKVQLFVNDPIYLTLFLQYLKEDKLRRIHSREVLNKNASLYYRAVENLLNFSSIRQHLPEVISLIQPFHHEFEEPLNEPLEQIDSSSRNISLKPLNENNLN